jgi:glycosyltransferase involved in cell wall biosynthesis
MDKKYNIVILTAPHPFKVSGIVAYDLMQNLKKAGHNVRIITNARLEKNYENTISLKNNLNVIYEKIINLFSSYFSKKIITDPDYHMYGLNQEHSNIKAKKILKKISFKPDAFIYLFPQFFLSVNDLNYLYIRTNAPIFWYMMDMAPMTGGCHYAWNCLGYINECGECPGIFSKDRKDRTNLIWKEKFDKIEQTKIIPIAASAWQLNQLKQSSLFKNKSHAKILLPINEKVFRAGNTIDARTLLGLPLDKKLIFFGAVSVNEKRKGHKELVDALRILKEDLTETEIENIHLIIAGKHSKKLENELQFNSTFLGYLNYSELATVFQASDVFVCPSIEDSGPMMINQSIMSGTPVVSFEMGVALDLVHTGITGYRAKLGNVKDLAMGIKFISELNEIKTKKMRENCHEQGLKLCSSQIQIKQFTELFRTNL